MLHILITGGTGLIGRALIARLPVSAKITVLTRNSEKAKRVLGGKLFYIESLEDIDFNQIDWVINLAGEPIADKRWSTKQKNILQYSRWTLTKYLAKKIKAAQNPPTLFISGSAIGFYGRQTKSNIDESETDVFQEFTHDLCKKWEDLALTAASAETRVVTLRTGIVLSTDGGALKKMLPAFRLGAGSTLASGEQGMSWVHIDDVVEAIVFIASHEEISGPVNLTAPFPASNKKFSLALARALHRPCFLNTPAWVLRAIFGEMSDVLVHGQHVVPKKLLQHGFSFQHTTIDHAFDHLFNTGRGKAYA